MIRFIFVCMTLVALSILTIAGQYMLHGIEVAKMDVAARNGDTVQAVEQAAVPSGPSFAEIYARAPMPEARLVNDSDDAAALNDIETAAGGGELSSGFTGIAPKALADDAPALPTINAETTEDVAN